MEIRYLKQILESLAHQFTDFSRQIKIEEGDNFSILSPNRVQVCFNITNFLKIQLNEVYKLRILVDSLSHLVQHIMVGDTPHKYREFVKKYIECPSLALVVLNCVEDVYVDSVRLEKYLGLKKACLFRNYLLSKTLPPLHQLSPRDQAVVGLVHLSLLGYIKDIDKLPKDVVVVLSECKKLLERVKTTHNFNERVKIAEEIIQLLKTLPGDDNSRIHKELPLCVSHEVKEYVDNIINTNLLLSPSGSSEDQNEHPQNIEISANLEDAIQQLSQKSVPSENELLQTTEFEQELIQFIQNQLSQLKSEEERIKKFGDPKERDRLVNWNYKIRVPSHIEQELYYLLYQLKTKEKYVESDCGRFINIKNYIRYVSGDVNVQDRLFYELKVVDVGNRAVLLVIDQSGSMQGKKLELVKLATHILATAVTELGDNLAIFGFRGSSVGGCEVIPILFWNERYREEYLSILYAVGSTPLREALLKAKEWIDEITAREKLIVVLTDGEPTTSTTHEVREVVEEIMREGVVVIGLGIGTKIKPKQLRECFGEGNFVWVPDLEELPRELFRVYLQQCGVI